MNRYIFIDNNSGFIWGDETIDDAQPLLACQRMVEEIGGAQVSYEMLNRANFSNQWGYYVYKVPLDFPQVDDGQDQALIDAVSAFGDIGFIAIRELED